MIEPRVPCEHLSATRALAESAGPVANRDAILAHAADCAGCGKYLRLNAPDLLLAAFNLDLPMPAPLDARELIRKLPARHSWRWQAAAAALLVAGVGFAVYRVAGLSTGDEKSRIAATAPGRHFTAPAIQPANFSAAAEPVIESGANDFSVSEYDAAGFDGKPVHWVRLRSDELAAPPVIPSGASAGAVRS